MNEERHPLVQRLIDICEDAVKQKDESDFEQLYRIAEDSGALNAFRAVGMSEEEIRKLLKSQMK